MKALNRNAEKLILILVPVVVFLLNVLASTFKIEVITNGLGFIFTALFSPILVLMFLVGMYMHIKDLLTRNRPAFSANTPSNKVESRFKTSRRCLIAALVLWGIGIALVLEVNRQAGYGGSEGAIVAIPFFFCAVVMTLITIVAFIIDLAGR